jgi:radical SAM protein with 4Fe4S-binding SPASM domain
MAAKNYCRITPDGKVTPCPYMPLVAGDTREDAFGKIWEKAPLFESLRNPPLQGRCGDCEYQELCGGCRARAYAATGDPLTEDPWCTYVPGTDRPREERREIALVWTADAEARIKKVPFFVRRMVRSAVEAAARREGLAEVTVEVLDKARRRVKSR